MPTTKTTPVTFEQIEDLILHDEFEGFGYLGHSHRRHSTDVALASAASDLRLPIADVFMWANSRCARHMMDRVDPRAHAFDLFDAFYDALQRDLPVLRDEVAS